MSEHRAMVRWTFAGGDFLKGRYSREHAWTFDGGLTVPASSSPAAVPKPYSNEANLDPEEAFVASITSCEDDAVGSLTKNERGVPWVSAIVLRPRLVYGGDKRPTAADEDRLHHL